MDKLFMIKILLKGSSEILELSKVDFENKMGMRWLDTLEFQSERIIKKVLKRSSAAMKGKELSVKAQWIGVHFHQEISKGFLPSVSIRWIDEKLGYGVFAEKDFPVGAYIGEYTGRIRKRKRRADRTNDYCFEYTIGDWIRNPYIIDAQNQGNFTRYINHSEKPNLEPLSVCADEVMHVILVTQKPIKKGTQFCYDYGELFWKKRQGELFRSF